MRQISVILTSLLLLPHLAFALSGFPSLDTTSGLRHWASSVRDVDYDCRELVQIKGAILCYFPDIGKMNEALTRLTLFSEGAAGFPKGRITRHDSSIVAENKNGIVGHDIPGEKVPTFLEQSRLACANERSTCLGAGESAFLTAVLPALQSRTRTALLAFSDVSSEAISSHEILHGQYFIDDDFRKGADAFVAGLNPKELTELKDKLGEGYYVEDPELVTNEIQAYLLENNAEQDSFLGPDLTRQFRPRLLQALDDKKVKAVEVVW